jgi:RNA polymerase sigma-70 factor (ECF subfamily)
MDDIDIIKRVKAGDTESFSLLVERYHKHLLNFIHRIVRDEKIVEDLGQDVFVSVYKSLKDYDEERGTPFSAWLFISARNRCISEIRKRRETLNLDEIPELRDRRHSAEETLMRREEQTILASSLALLEEPYRSSILMSLRGDSLEKIAAADGVPVGTVKSRLSRAREKIRKFVAGHIGGKGYERV